MLGAKVGRALAEDLRQVLSSLGLVDKTVAIVDDHDHIVIPLLGRPGSSTLSQYGAVIVERSFEPRKHRVDPIDRIRAAADVPESLRQHLPDKWERLGDVIVIRLQEQLDGFEGPVGSVYGSVLGAKAVLRETGGITGDFRTPAMKRIFGNDSVTTHKENGILYRFDAEKIMFSSGNEEERLRMAGLECGGETVIDMFAGIGYFSLPLAVYQKPARVISCELNPVSHSYLVENVSLNKVEHIVSPVLGDNRDLRGESIADRIIMGYVKTTHEFLPTAMRLLKDGGVVHYHETCPTELLPSRPLERLSSAAGGRKVEVLRMKEIKSYAPGVGHVVIDARVVRPA